MHKPQLQELSKKEISLKVKEWLRTHEVTKLPEQSVDKIHWVGFALHFPEGESFSSPNMAISRTTSSGALW